MNFSNLNLDHLVNYGFKFGVGLLKKNVEKAVADNAVKVVKNAVFGKNTKQNIKNNNIRLKAGDSVTFVVTKRGLEAIPIEESPLDPGLPVGQTHIPNTCTHQLSADHLILCDICLKNQLKSKL